MSRFILTTTTTVSSSSKLGSKLSSIGKPVLIVAAVAAVVVIALAIGLGVGLSSSGAVRLAATRSGEFSFAVSGTRANGKPRIVARSYDGLAWEAVRDHDRTSSVEVVCETADSSTCWIRGAGSPTIVPVNVSDDLKQGTPDMLAARLLLQGTFGATSAELAAAVTEIQARGAAGWIAQQMALPPSLLREYIRKRTNPSPGFLDSVAGIIGICERGSRWRNFTATATCGTTTNCQNVADNNLDFVPVSQNGTDYAVTRWVGCDPSKVTNNGTTAFFTYRGYTYQFMPRIKLLSNTVEGPAGGTVGDMCPAVEKSFVNARGCVRRASCGTPGSSSVALELNNATLRRWFTGSQRYVYVVSGLRFEGPGIVDLTPCVSASRWRRNNGACAQPSTLSAPTTTLLTNALRASTDPNPFVRDIDISGGAGCVATVGISITVDNVCWTHIHPAELTVRDFTQWGTGGTHPGGDQNIRKWAEVFNTVELRYPASHPMDRWSVENLALIPAVGRFGDFINYQSLATSLQTPDMATFAGAGVTGFGAFESCGSPGEGPNDGTLGHRYILKSSSLDTNAQLSMLDRSYDLFSGKSMAWLNHALTSPDQLRQRVAWALQQIFTMADNGAMFRDEVEVWGSYYDIFVRHAFGNYRDILKEVTYHPIMGVYLTYRGSTSFQQNGRRPDENYAREIMQLFSVGLYGLNEDGTHIQNPDGTLRDTYTDADIVEFSRIFTGFDRAPVRSNIQRVDGGTQNSIDPMEIKPLLRDRLPKAKLDEGYIGDQYPLCRDLPPQPWRRPGAKFVYTGTSSDEGNAVDTTVFAGRPRFQPVEDSPLYNLLCGPRAGALCTFPSEVVLDQTLPCAGAECSAEDVVTVKIVRGTQTGYFTFVKQPCVELTFFQEGRMLQYQGDYQCGDHFAAIGNPQCCQKTSTQLQGSSATTPGLCAHINERATFATVKARCEAADLSMCTGRRNRYPSWATSCAQEMPTWVDESCSLRVQVLPNGMASVVDRNGTVAMFRENNGNIFRVRWADKKYPQAIVSNCGAGCKVVNYTSDLTCVCDIEVTSQPLFSTTVPTAAVVRATAPIGAPPVSSFDPNTYTLCSTAECRADPTLKVWVKAGTNWTAETTIFETSLFLYAGDRVRFFMNRVSTVRLAEQPEISFRNPPRFMPLLGEFPVRTQPYRGPNLYLPNAEEEVQALLDHLSFHPNTAPFIAYRLIQRLVTSNPSLRYVQSVAKAFKTGEFGGKTYSGLYGDMAATVAAVFLDQEARSLILEADPSHGSIREPILKLLNYLRSLEFQPKPGVEVHMPSLMDRIAQDAFRQPSVFGFYLPTFRPDGPAEENGLVAPEAMIMTTPSTVYFFNGLTSLIDNGLTFCEGGFGYNFQRSCGSLANRRNTNDGEFKYQPANSANVAAVIDDLDKMLTGKRLAPQTKVWLSEAYTRVLAVNGADAALRTVLKLFLTTVEFQIMGGARFSDQVRPVAPPKAPSTTTAGRGYKAVVIVFLGGGADSWNLIVPRNGCGRDYYNEYQTVRTLAAIPSASLLPITVAGQPCTEFGVHPSMTALRQMYLDGDAAFFANIGGLVEPLTKDEWRTNSGKLKPPSPSAHDISQRSMANLHAQEATAKGVVGRAVDALNAAAAPFNTGMYSVAGNAKILDGIFSRPDIIDQNQGVVQLINKALISEAVGNITQYYGHNFLGESYSQLVGTSLRRTEEIATALAGAVVPSFGNDGWNRQLQQVAKLIKIRQTLGTERAFFFTSRGGWDTHGSHSPPWAAINDGLNRFATEMKSQAVWDDVAVVTISDFGRTLTSNGAGTDHAWGGHHFLAGGSVKGGRFHGKYPNSIALDSELNINNRGSLIPTSGWERMWNGVLQWMDVPAATMSQVLPNLHRFPSDTLSTRQDLFEN